MTKILKFTQAQRAYLNNNRLQMEEEVDNIMNELWKLKRKIHNSYKDTHYTLLDLAWYIKKISMLTDELSEEWRGDSDNLYLKAYPFSNHNTRNTQRKLEFDDDEEEEESPMSPMGALFG